MAQNPLAATIAKNPLNAQTTLQASAGGELNVQPGGKSSALNVTAAAVIKATAGTLHKIIVVAPGTTSGALTINDTTTTGGGTAANTILSIAYTGLTAGQVISVDWPCANGIVVTAVPGAGSPIFSLSFS